MVTICFYFEVHQPFRLRHYNVFDIGINHEYWYDEKNKDIMRKVARKCYLPTNKLILRLIQETKGKFKASFSVTGVALEQFGMYAPEVLESFRKLAKTGCVEFISETYYHSLSYMYSKEEFVQQVEKHKKLLKKELGITPRVFRNTELIYNNELAKFIEDMGYKGIIAEGADHVLGWRSPNYVYRPVNCEKIKLLLKNYKLSDDIAFRFSNPDWKEYPLSVEKYAGWINSVNGSGNTINLFMDYETFGEHQWSTTGIFRFMGRLPHEILKHPDNNFMTVSEVADSYEPMADLDIHHMTSWADLERDLSAWLGNNMQHNAINELYRIESMVKETGDPVLLEDWRRLTTSDHFYYMCTKWFADGDVHKYFNPYDSPYDSFIAFMNVLKDIEHRVKKHYDKGGIDESIKKSGSRKKI
ncbi:glycoside hydrolase family 57 protein [Candidatus Woesearchaeota archaeon]|nr:glycoside hydrolase family 57 protein [Candidatus Woesearchaeota archaeon]